MTAAVNKADLQGGGEERAAAPLGVFRQPLLGFAVGVVLIIGAVIGPAYVWVGILLAQLIVVAYWHQMLVAPAALSGMAVGLVLIGAADIAAVASDLGERSVSFGPIVGILGAGYLLAVVQQLTRRDGRPELTLSISATVSLAAVGALGAGWAVIPRLLDGESLVLLTATAVTAAAVGRSAPRLVGAIVGPLAAGILSGVVMGSGLDEVGAGLGATVGFAAAVPMVLAALASVRLPGRRPGWQASAVWPVLLAATLVYLVLRFAGH